MSPGALAIEVDALAKAFRLPEEQRTTLLEHFLHPLRRTRHVRNQALDGVSFAVARGEFFGIVGPNGSGKSTLLKILAGIYRGDEGAVRIRGRVSPFIELGVGFNYELTARDNVWINATLLGLDRAEIRERLPAVFAFAELEQYEHQKLKNFSSGMLLRLAFSIAVQAPFDVLLLDEVLAVGDARFQERCFATLDAFRAEGKTIVFVSHDLDAIEAHCDRALLLEHGRVRSLGEPAEVVAAYRGRQAAPEEVPLA